MTSKGIAVVIFLFGIGVFLHFSSDMQKYTALKLNPGQLITDGLFQKSRNMNYVGEFFIYLSFALLSMHWLPIFILAVFISIVWVPNMIKKDRNAVWFVKYCLGNPTRKSEKVSLPS